jgi:glycosyltransferase involved in cell wall biosynthesis
MARPIRSLLFSTLYPNSERPGHGIFVETRLRHLVGGGEVEAEVIAPVPWFPFRSSVFGEYAREARVPRYEKRNGFDVHHPRFLRLPKVGMNRAPFALARTGLAAARQLRAGGRDFDLIDAHYFYPDGVAAALMGDALGKPVVITARGSDINLIARFNEPRRLILEAGRKAAAIIAVSSALRDAMIEIGIDGSKISVLGNGVDASLFYEEDRSAARARWAVDGFVLASVGNLVPLKGHDIVIRALPGLPDCRLLIAGQGPERERLEQIAAATGVADRVRFVGHLAQPDLRSLYSAADCLILASEREGWPNVLLEAMACGAQVVATRVGGIPEILGTSTAARLMNERTDRALVDAVVSLRRGAPSRTAAREHALRHDWKGTTEGQVQLFRAATRSRNA